MVYSRPSPSAGLAVNLAVNLCSPLHRQNLLTVVHGQQLVDRRTSPGGLTAQHRWVDLRTIAAQ